MKPSDRYLSHAQKLRAIREERDPIVQAWSIRALIPSNRHVEPEVIAAERVLDKPRRKR